MFVRKKKNRSGTTSIVVVDKHGGKFKEIHTVGIAHNDDEINSLCAKGRQWINNHLGIQLLDFDGFSRKEKEVKTAETMLENIDTILLNGAKLIIDKVYDSIGFNKIEDETLRQLVVARFSRKIRLPHLIQHQKCRPTY